MKNYFNVFEKKEINLTFFNESKTNEKKTLKYLKLYYISQV